jgi:hypothetical protein
MLTIINPKFLTYKTDFLTIDILGGVDLHNLERLVCTLRISYQNYPPFRTTLDLYNDNQTDKLQRTLCDKWQLKLLEVSTAISSLTDALESFRLGGQAKPVSNFQINENDKNQAIEFLKNKNLIFNLVENLNKTGILGEDDNAVILFLALASYKFENPFSVLCLAKSGIGKSYILQKLSECMPPKTYSFHTKISANALYYFDSNEIQNKALLIEDLEWTTQMLSPLATLQSQGKLVNTRATKDKDGMLHSTTFEVVGKLCLVACAYSDKNFEEMGLPFLCLHLNHSQNQDIAIMEYQKKCKAGLIKTQEINQIQHLLKCVIASLENVGVINPFAPLIDLPKEVAYPRKSLLLLLNFIEVITYFFQFQREQIIDQETGEILIKTHPNDIELAFKYLQNSLLRRADELSTSTRGFYNWLIKFLDEAKTNQFTALDIRKIKPIHPRTLNRYLQELKLYSHLQIVGGNKHREGFVYKITGFGSQSDVQHKIEKEIRNTLNKVWEQYNKNQGISEQETENREVRNEEIEEKNQNSMTDFLETINQPFTSDLVIQKLGLSERNTRYQLKTLTEQGFLQRKRVGNGYQYNKAAEH